MKLADAFVGVRRVYIEAAPLIYYIEENAAYIERMDAIVSLIDRAPLEAVSSVITLTEVLNQPMKLARADLERAYRDILLNSNRFHLLDVTTAIADVAARLRAEYSLRTPDALHVATALQSNCDLFLTNDSAIKRVAAIRVVTLDELEAN